MTITDPIWSGTPGDWDSKIIGYLIETDTEALLDAEIERLPDMRVEERYTAWGHWFAKLFKIE